MFMFLPCKRSNGTDNLEETHIERLLDPESYIYDNGEDPIEVDCDKALPLEKKKLPFENKYEVAKTFY